MAAFVQFLAVLSLCLATGVAQARDVAVQGLTPDRAVLRVDGVERTLRLGETRDGITLLGISAREARLRVDGEERRLGLESPAPAADASPARAERSEAPTLVLSQNRDGQFVTSGMINGRVVRFLVDTGASTVSMSRNEAARVGIDFRRFGRPCMSQTANGNLRCWVVLLDKVKVGPIIVPGVFATVRDLDEESLPILLGMSFLERVRIEHDGERLKLTGR